MNATINVVCFKSKTLSNGEHPLMIRICKSGKRRYKSIELSIKPEHWDFTKNKPKKNCPNKDVIQKIIIEKEKEYQEKQLDFKSDSKDYTVSMLIEKNENKKKTLDEFYTELISYYKSIDKLGNACIYRDSYHSLKRFKKGNIDFYFSEIDLAWLNSYEKWLRSNGKAETTISLLFRTLRSAFNKALENNNAGKVINPFRKFKVSKFNTKTKKRAISKDDIFKIINADLSEQKEYVKLSRDLFIFSYLCGGINYSDMAGLKYENIESGQLIYNRKKTGKKIILPLNTEALNIVKNYMTEDRVSVDYIFPILDKNTHKTEQQRFNRLHKVMGKVNPALKKIAKLAKIDTNLTTYVARHSYATVLKNSGVNIALIGETLGHADLKTTMIYLDSFDDKQIGEAMGNLL